MADTFEAGEFSEWVDHFLSTMKGEGEGDVPCGECVGCCTSAKFIHIKPRDSAAIKVIPSELLFSAPGLPTGHFVLGYDHNGHCPMFSQGKCSIYAHRPETCRQYDCRVLSATGAPTVDESEVISNRISAWEFQYASPASRRIQQTIALTVEFLSAYSDDFPKGMIPQTTPQLSAFAIRIHTEFAGLSFESASQRASELITTITQKY